VEIAAFEAKVLKLAADGKISQDVSDGIAKLIGKANQPVTIGEFAVEPSL
jgi:hypothetical protein